jgi:hypothetical protein
MDQCVSFYCIYRGREMYHFKQSKLKLNFCSKNESELEKQHSFKILLNCIFITWISINIIYNQLKVVRLKTMLKYIWLLKDRDKFKFLSISWFGTWKKCSYSIEYGTNDLIVMFRCLKISFLSLMKYAVNALSKC